MGVEDDVAHTEAQSIAYVLWLLCLSEIFDYQEEIASDLTDLLLRLVRQLIQGPTRLLSPYRHEVNLEFILQDIGRVEVVMLTEIRSLKCAVHHLPGIWRP